MLLTVAYVRKYNTGHMLSCRSVLFQFPVLSYACEVGVDGPVSVAFVFDAPLSA